MKMIQISQLNYYNYFDPCEIQLKVNNIKEEFETVGSDFKNFRFEDEDIIKQIVEKDIMEMAKVSYKNISNKYMII